jgi:hypothetical protein
MSANAEEISKTVQEHILHSFDSYGEMMDELKNSQKHFDHSRDFGSKMVESGFFLAYPEDIRRFLQNITGEPPEVQADKYSPEQSWDFYKNLINREVPKILSEGGRSHIKPETPENARASKADGGEEFDVWIKKEDRLPSYLGEKLFSYEELIHSFGGATVGFIVHPSSNDQETAISFGRKEFKGKEGDFRSGGIDISGNIHTAKMLVHNAIKHFDEAQDISMADLSLYLESKNNDLLWGAEFKSPQDFMNTVQLAKKAGYVQGVCECVAAVGDDHALGKKLLSEMNVTKDTAKKFAEPETYKVLEQGIFAPQQKLEQTHSIKR